MSFIKYIADENHYKEVLSLVEKAKRTVWIGTYAKIYDGEWIDDVQPYHVVHRIASYPDAHGIFSSIMDFCFSHDTNIRIDTHRDNKIMQHNILKQGFTYCGIIYLQSGDALDQRSLATKGTQERLAYQKMVSR